MSHGRNVKGEICIIYIADRIKVYCQKKAYVRYFSGLFILIIYIYIYII